MVLLYSARLSRRAVTRPGSGLTLPLGTFEFLVKPVGHRFDVGRLGRREAFRRHLAGPHLLDRLLPELGFLGDGAGRLELLKVDISGFHLGVVAGIAVLREEWLDRFLEGRGGRLGRSEPASRHSDQCDASFRRTPSSIGVIRGHDRVFPLPPASAVTVTQSRKY